MIGLVLALAFALLIVGAIGVALTYRAVRRRRLAAGLRIDSPDGIVEQGYLDIGGIQQWVQIRGEHRSNPVLLVIHGGPGSPYSIFTPLLRSWEKHFTVVQWDRRGAGLTYARNGKRGGGDFGRQVSDGIEVVEYLRRHLQQHKVILFAGSMGTIVGLPMLRQRPDLFSAYVGSDLYVDMVRNEAVGYQLTLDRVRQAGNTRAVAALTRIGADPTRWDLRAWGVKMAWTMKTDPVTPDGVTRLLIPLVLTSPLYNLRQVFAFFAGFQYSQRTHFAEYMAFDARALGTRFEVPFFVFQGAQDVLTVTALATEYAGEIDAPTTALALIPDASHFVAFTHPDEFLAELLTHVFGGAATGSVLDSPA